MPLRQMVRFFGIIAPHVEHRYGGGMSMTAPENFDQVIERYHLALDQFMKGNPEPAQQMFSQRDDVSLGNPFGPFVHGRQQVIETAGRAATNYREGEAMGFDTVAKYVTPDLAYIAEVEHLRSKVGESQDPTPVALRVTSIFRPEDGTWKLVHRHADPITSAQPAESVIQR